MTRRSHPFRPAPPLTRPSTHTTAPAPSSHAFQEKKKKKSSLGLNKTESVAFNPNAAGHIPGYTGYIRGADQLAGVRFGIKTRMACTQTVEDLMCDTAIPPKVPEEKIAYESNKESVAAKIEDEPRRVPGYMGYVAGSRDKFGDTFGRTTAQALKTSYEYEGFRNQQDQREKRRQTAAGLGKGADGMFHNNNMTLTRG